MQNNKVTVKHECGVMGKVGWGWGGGATEEKVADKDAVLVDFSPRSLQQGLSNMQLT